VVGADEHEAGRRGRSEQLVGGGVGHEYERRHERVGAGSHDGERSAHELDVIADREAVPSGHQAPDGDLVVGLRGTSLAQLPRAAGSPGAEPMT
jgi:hypothetical protein